MYIFLLIRAHPEKLNLNLNFKYVINFSGNQGIFSDKNMRLFGHIYKMVCTRETFAWRAGCS